MMVISNLLFEIDPSLIKKKLQGIKVRDTKL